MSDAFCSRLGAWFRVVFASIAMAAVAPCCVAQGAREIHDAKGESAEAGFVDLHLGIDSMKCDSWSDCVVHASGLFHGKRVALDVFVQAQGGSAGVIVYRSVGADSDALLGAMAALYKRPLHRTSFARSVTAEIAFLGVEDGKMDGKVFFASNGPQADYAELYTNIDRRRRVLEIHEKDPDYRDNVLKGLSR